MHVLIVKIGEPMPGEGLRLRRMTALAQGLVARGHEVTWVSSAWCHQKKAPRDAEMIRRELPAGFRVVLLDAPGYKRNLSPMRFLHHLIFAIRLRRFLRKSDDYALAWIAFPTIPAAVAAASWSKKTGKPVVFDVRDLSPDIFVEQCPAWLRRTASGLLAPVRILVGRSFARAAAIVGVSHDYLGWAQAQIRAVGRPAVAGHVIPLGYAADQGDALSREQVFAAKADAVVDDDTPLQLFYAGTFGVSYDIETLAGAAVLLQQRKLPAVIRIAGGGDARLEQRLQALAADNEHLDYLGWLDPARLHKALLSSDIGLMAYVGNATQGLPNKIYEYMANGLMLANSLQGEATELVNSEGVGRNYQAGNPESLVDLVHWALANRADVLRMGKAAWQLYDKDFRADQNVQKMVNLIESAAVRQADSH